MSKDTYPEHLNPFYEGEKKKSTLSLSNSFRGFTKTLRKSFRFRKRDKDEDKVEIRQKLNNIPIKIVSCPPENEFSTPLPRSRIQERLAKTDEIHYRASLNLNPFEDKDKINATKTRRRRKKRAPLPPKSISNQNLTDGNYIANHHSKWSLTSGDTEYSYATDISGLDCHHHFNDDEEDEFMKEKFEHFNDEMKKLNDDKNIISNEISEDTNNNVPDLVVSCPSGDKELENNNNSLTDEVEEINMPNKKDHQGGEEVTVEPANNLNDDDDDNDDNKNKNKLIIKEEDMNENETFLYYERKSIYILGSRDELNNSNTSYVGRCSLYITGSTEEIDSVDNNNEIYCEDSSVEIVPKQRKNKLTKEALLGTAQ